MTESQRGQTYEEPVVINDRRKIDPETGQLREQSVPTEQPNPVADQPGAEPEATSGPSLGESIVDEAVSVSSQLEKELAERTADLQRLQAEYANYRRRVERDRESVITGAKATVASDLLPLLDDLERAAAHGDLTGAFKSVGDKLIGALDRAGLESFGTKGEAFDPSVHEAVQHDTSPEVSGPTVTTVMRRGYRFGERVLRPAMVAVTDHEPAPASPAGVGNAVDAEVVELGTDPVEPPGAPPVDPPVEGELPIDRDGNAG